MVITDGITGAWANDAASETRYKPCPLRFPAGVLREGEVRYVTPGSTLPTRYTFTGQSSHVADEATDLWTSGFGLIFYNACWLRSVPGMECRGYDPALGRFAQADTVIPGARDPQAWDRYDIQFPTESYLYDQIELQIVWKILQQDLESLKAEITKVYEQS